jgi:hypothetical protein
VPQRSFDEADAGQARQNGAVQNPTLDLPGGFPADRCR